MMNKFGKWLFILHLIFALYFINFAFSYVTLPEFFLGIEKWIFFIGGILILFGGFSHLRARKRGILKDY
jgi:uncharacterized membrane protein YagU involved in acid resistance